MRSKLLFSLLALTILIFNSCDPSDITDQKKENKTTYTILYNIDNSSLFDDYISLGASFKENVYISEYNDISERINIQDMDDIHYGSRKTFTSHSLAKKIAVCIEIEISFNGKTEDFTRWVANVFYLENNSNTIIEINNETRVSSYCPVN